MYKDAKEELKRLEKALLEECEEDTSAEDTWEEDQEDMEEKKPSTTLLTIVLTLAAGILAVLIFWFVRYGRVFL